jgi:hypothetical protein
MDDRYRRHDDENAQPHRWVSSTAYAENWLHWRGRSSTVSTETGPRITRGFSSAGFLQTRTPSPVSKPLTRMRRDAGPTFVVLASSLVLSIAVGQLSGQAPPPPEMKPWVMMDVGPIPAPSICGCVTNPFTVTPPRPGYGYGSGLAAPDSDAPLTAFTARFQAERDAEDRANLPSGIETG